MGNAGTALMGIGQGKGKTRAVDAAQAAISSPLLDFPITKAKGIVFNIVGGSDMTLQEINAAAEVIYANVDTNANIIFGALVDDKLNTGEVSITVLATGFETDFFHSEEGEVDARGGSGRGAATRPSGEIRRLDSRGETGGRRSGSADDDNDLSAAAPSSSQRSAGGVPKVGRRTAGDGAERLESSSTSKRRSAESEDNTVGSGDSDSEAEEENPRPSRSTAAASKKTAKPKKKGGILGFIRRLFGRE
eukprot:gene42581-52030_t